MDKEKEIEEITDLLVNQGVFNNLVCRQDYAYPDAVIYENCRQVAEILVNTGYGHIPTALNAYLHSNVKAAAMIDSIVAIKQREAVKEFAEKLKEMLAENSIEDGFDYDYLDYSGTIQTIDELLKEYEHD